MTIKQLWNGNPFLEKMFYLMNTFKLPQEDAERIAKLEWNKIPKEYKEVISKALKS